MPSGLFIISAPSGSGKTTLVRELFKLVPGLRFSISYTTRTPRGSEENGREYFFVSRAEFEAMIRREEFLEHAEVFGNYYGTAWSFLHEAQQRNEDLVLDIDVQGAGLVKARFPEARGIFIAPPDRETLAWRLSHRGLDRPEVVERRLRDASREIAAYARYDYVLINDRLRESVEALAAIVVSERARLHGPPPEFSPAELERFRELTASCLQSRVHDRLAPILHSFGIEAAAPAR